MTAVAIAIPLRETDELFPELLEGLAAQTMQEFTVTVEKGPAGYGANVNRAVSRSPSSEFLQIMGRDVVLAPEYLETMVAAAQTEDACVTYADYDLDGVLVGHFTPGPFDPERMKRGNSIPTEALVRRSCFRGFSEDRVIARLADWHHWRRMSAAGCTFHYVSGFTGWRQITSPGDMSVSSEGYAEAHAAVDAKLFRYGA